MMTERLNELDEIRACEDRRYAAAVEKNIEVLDELFHDRLIYMHSSGVTDSKTSYLDGIREGVWDYHGIERSEPRIVISGDVALVFADLSIRMTTRGDYRAFDTRALAVWQRCDDRWRLLSVHSGAIPPAH
jgi:ketosteroid isomerase-like protein